MAKYFGTYAATALVMVLIDMVWLGVIAKPFYQQGIGHLMADSPKLWAAVLFYVLYPVGLVVFGVLPNAVNQAVSVGWLGALLAGAVFGFLAYATYDLTNLATLKDWPLSIALIDMAWGTAVSGVSAAVGWRALQHFSAA